MEKQLLTTVFIFLFCLLYTVAIAAQTKGAEDSNTTIDVTSAAVLDARTLVRNLGFGKRVDVKLTDGSKTSGRITGVAADRFVVTNSKGAVKPIAYREVSRITRQNEKLGLFNRPWVGIMFTAAGVGTLIVLALQFFD